MIKSEELVLAGGCFWGLEDLIRHQPGVVDTEVGYTGGQNKDPDYHNHPGQRCNGCDGSELLGVSGCNQQQ